HYVTPCPRLTSGSASRTSPPAVVVRFLLIGPRAPKPGLACLSRRPTAPPACLNSPQTKPRASRVTDAKWTQLKSSHSPRRARLLCFRYAPLFPLLDVASSPASSQHRPLPPPPPQF